MLQLACQRGEPVATDLNLNKILGGKNTAGFERAMKAREFHFPADHAAHPGFRNEWWYVTGNVADAAGRFYGYQVTFFRTALAPLKAERQQSEQQPDNDSATEPVSKWKVRDVWMAHAAITDIDARQHYATQRFSRANPGLAGARIHPLRVWLEDWQLRGAGDEFPWQLDVKTAEFDLNLNLIPVKNLVMQGNQGLSQKSPEPGNASYYYSYSRLRTAGKLRIKNQQANVRGLSWFDREWSTSSLDQNQTGWNWFSLQLDSGEDLMYYQMLDSQGMADPNSQGKWIDKSGNSMSVQPHDVALTILDEWRSNTGQDYPIRWRMDYKAINRSWIIQAAVKDQLMDLAVKYWEGAVLIYDAPSMQQVGRGYLEMTRTP